MALRSGKAYTEIYYDDGPINSGFEDMQGAYVEEDVPDRSNFTNDLAPDLEELPDLNPVPDVPQYENYIEPIEPINF